MLDFSIAGPIIGLFADVDVLLHLSLDLRKARTNARVLFREPSFRVSSAAMAPVVVTTLLAFLLVLTMSVSWLFPDGPYIVILLYPFYYELPAIV